MTRPQSVYILQEDRTHGSSNWAAFDDLATERTSQLDSVFEQSQKQGPETPQQAAHTEPQPTPPQTSASGENWDAFGSSRTDWGASDSSSRATSTHQTPPSASWAAFDDPPDADSGQLANNSASTQQQQQPLSQQAEQEAGHVNQDESMQAADFGGSNYWRTHPLALVDEVE